MRDQDITRRLTDRARAITARLAAGVLGHVALDLEHALDRRLEAELRGLARRDLLLDVVAVQVDVVGRVGAHREQHAVAVLDLISAGPPTTSPPRMTIPVTTAFVGAGVSVSVSVSVGAALGAGAGLGLRRRRRLRGLVTLVVPARTRDQERHHRDHKRGDDQPDALVPRHAAPKYGNALYGGCNAGTGSAPASACGSRHLGGTAPGAFAGHADLIAYAAPLCVVALPLLAGRYFGEETLERLRERAEPARRHGAAPLLPGARRSMAAFPRGGRLIAQALAERGPPSSALT